jgi:hypothetical protein
VLVLPLGIDAALGIGRGAPRQFLFYALAALANAVLFFIPFLLWVSNVLPLYTLAFYLALTLGTAALLVEYRRASRTLTESGEAGRDMRLYALAIYVILLVALGLLRATLF